ncbi:disulfide oxidoreductase [Penicillium capsulatum]|uniref:Disulfide oxidoreductase n=1 Tax=Penicillium capsulatum TaxID=69766 RepID=A0A9W9IRN6_9EURO|nr:disulfide oxidoreductase [Penicillium capsulatum]KAJ6129433.1 disulfide oxidoreductase [Penicillium capsulatum]
MAPKTKKTVAIIGSGWAGYNLAHALYINMYSVMVISPEENSAITPLLASVDIDFDKKILICQPTFESIKDKKMRIPYNKVVVAPGCSTNTFNTPGVEEHAFLMKNVHDANTIWARLNEDLKIASLPCTSEEEQKRLLYITIVGGGLTGIEIVAELTDLFKGDLQKLYPHLNGKGSVTVYNVAP